MARVTVKLLHKPSAEGRVGGLQKVPHIGIPRPYDVDRTSDLIDLIDLIE
jgi:hypothetical protein